MRKNIFVAIISVFTISCVLAGCGEDTATVPSATAEESEVASDSDSGQIQKDYKEELIDQFVEDTKELEEIREEARDAEEEAAATREADAVTFNLKDNTIYDKDGVLITLDFINSLRATITVQNNNPDNKKITFGMKNIALNGVFQQVSNREELNAGGNKSISIEFISDMDNRNLYETDPDHFDSTLWGDQRTIYEKMQDVYKDLGAENMEVLTVGIDYELIIGSDAAPEDMSAILYTDKYNNPDDLKKYYGELIKSVSESDLSFYGEKLKSFDVYINSKEANKYSIVYVSTGEPEQKCHELEYRGLLLNGRECGIQPINQDFHSKPQINGNGMINVYTYELDPQKIRVENEIPNDKEVKVDVYLYTGEDHSQDWPVADIYAPVTTLPPL